MTKTLNIQHSTLNIEVRTNVSIYQLIVDELFLHLSDEC